MTTEINVADLPLGSSAAFNLVLQDEGAGRLSLKRLPGVTANPGLVYDSRAALYADLAHPAPTQAWVLGDTTVGYNGVYQKSGASGSGSWTRKSDLPVSVIFAIDAGAGTANAIVATSSLPISGSALVAMQIYETTTSSPVTVAFNGATAVTIKTSTGNDVATGGLLAGMWVLGIVSGTTYRLVSDQASAAIQAAAEAAQTAAEAARDAAETFADAAAAVSEAFARVPDRTTLKALNTASITEVYLTETGRADVYVWRLGNYTAAVAADTGEHTVIKADAVSAGTGAWVRQTSGVLRVASRSIMKMIDTGSTTAVMLMEAGREGLFLWRTGNYSAHVTNDPEEGVHVKATAVAASAGAWVRQFEGPPDIRWFGAVSDVVWAFDYVITSTVGSPNVTATGASFTTGDVGKPIMVAGIGTSSQPLTTTISAVTDATHIVLAANASTAVTTTAKQVAYGTDSSPAMQAALDYIEAMGAGLRGNVVRIPDGKFALKTQVTVAPYCGFEGVDRSCSQLFVIGAAGTFAFQYGSNPSNALNYYMQARNVQIYVCAQGKNVFDIYSPCMSLFENISVDGVLVKLSPICFRVDGSNASGFFTAFRNILCNHVYFGYYIHSTGTEKITQLLFDNCTAFGDVGYGETTSVGMYFNNSGDNSIIRGGNMEMCGTGIYLYNGTRCVTMDGARFESNTIDFKTSANSNYNTLIGCAFLENLDDQSSTTTYVGCAGTQMTTGLVSKYVYGATSATSANMAVVSSGNVVRATSAAKYKTDVGPISDEMLARFLQLDGITYRSACPSDDPAERHIGVIADQADALGLRELVTYGDDGAPEGFAYDRTTAFLLEAVKRLARQVAELEQRH